MEGFLSFLAFISFRELSCVVCLINTSSRIIFYIVVGVVFRRSFVVLRDRVGDIRGLIIRWVLVSMSGWGV